MSRAFVNEDAGGAREPSYDLPEPGSPLYAEASAWALLQGADEGDSVSAEKATGYAWGDPALVPHVRTILERAREEDNSRLAQLARRFIRAAGEKA